VKASQLPDQYQNVFTDLERADSAVLPLAGSYEAQCFRNIFNDQFATAEHMITSESSKETQALLPEIRQTMEVIGDDELNLTYDEWVYLVTGWYPKNNKSMSLGSRARRGTLAFTALLTDGADADAPVDAYGKFVARHTMGFNKNLIAIEPSFLCFVAGVWEPPNSGQIYGGLQATPGSDQDPGTTGDQVNVDVSQVTNLTLNRYQANAPSSQTLDRGVPKGIENMRSAANWLADPSSEDAIGDLGDRAALNYWLNGDVSFDFDRDPYTMGFDSTSSTLKRTREGSEGAESFITDVDFHVGVATLQHFPDA
jgi:hypothetical protein